MLPALYIGIDNGSTGGIAALDDLGDVYRVDPMPATDGDLLMILEALEGSCAARRSFAYLEHAQAFPKMGTSSAFNYGRGYGAMQMALIATGIPHDIVTPRKWQASLSCLTGGDKNVSKRRAIQLFPNVKVTHAIADALLIAEYCRRMRSAHGNKTTEGQTERSGGQGPKQNRRQGDEDARLEELERQIVAAEATAAGAPDDEASPRRAARRNDGGSLRRPGHPQR